MGKRGKKPKTKGRCKHITLYGERQRGLSFILTAIFFALSDFQVHSCGRFQTKDPPPEVSNLVPCLSAAQVLQSTRESGERGYIYWSHSESLVLLRCRSNRLPITELASKLEARLPVKLEM